MVFFLLLLWASSAWSLEPQDYSFKDNALLQQNRRCDQVVSESADGGASLLGNMRAYFGRIAGKVLSYMERVTESQEENDALDDACEHTGKGLQRSRQKDAMANDLVMLSIPHEIRVTQELFDVARAHHSDKQGCVRYCASFRGARSMTPAALSAGVDLFVGRLWCHDSHAVQSNNDFSPCFADVPGQKRPTQWIFMADSGLTCEAAGEFFHQWFCDRSARKERSSIAFYFAFSDCRCDEKGVSNRIIEQFLRADDLSGRKAMDAAGLRGASYMRRFRGMQNFAEKYVSFCWVQNVMPPQKKILSPHHNANTHFSHKVKETSWRGLRRLSAIDLLVGVPGGFDEVSRAHYINAVYGAFEQMLCDQGFKGRLGYIDGSECANGPVTSKADHTLVYVVPDNVQAQMVIGQWVSCHLLPRYNYRGCFVLTCF